MKKKLLALVCALVMIFSLASCGLSTPDTVGKVGDFEVSSGLYLLAQFSAYQQAAQLAGKDQDTTDVKAFLKETITTDADSGETAVVQDYVADKTLETLRTFAAIDARFADLGGDLTAEQTQVADNYAQQLMDQYGSTYTANGIGLETLKAFERIQLKHTLLLTLVYGPDGESPVDDSDLTEHLDSQMYELAYVNIPLYNTSTFVFASDDQKAQMLQLAQAAAASCSETQDGSVSEQVSALHSAASAALPNIDCNCVLLHSGLLLLPDHSSLQCITNALHLLPFYGSDVSSMLFLCHRTGIHKILPLDTEQFLRSYVHH